MTEISENSYVGNADGTPRSGKDSSADHLAAKHGLAVIEAGRLYRFQTLQMLESGLIVVGTSKEAVQEATEAMDDEEYVKNLDRTADFVREKGLGRLYEPDIEALVGMVANTAISQRLVNEHIESQVQQKIDDGVPVFLTVGRGLAQVAKRAGAEVMLDMFMRCSPENAAIRECLRKKIDPSSAEGQAVYRKLQARIEEDATRPKNPVIPAKDAENYADLAERGMTDREIGRLAAKNGLQIVFDTDEVPLAPMKEKVEGLYEGALSHVVNRAA